MKLPKARTEHLLEQNFKSETLIYDLKIDKAFNLNETSTIVYKACSSEKTFDELKQKHKFTDDFIYLALDELRRNNLLAEGEKYQSPFVGINRRDVIKKVGFASMYVLPIISGLVAPKAAQAASGVADSSGGSGGSNGLGNYREKCQLIPTPSGPAYVCNDSLQCADTTAGDGICCMPSSINRRRHFSGESFSYTDASPVYALLSNPPTVSDNCPYELPCCDGRSAYGTCTYVRYQGEDGGDYEDPGGGYGYYIKTCDCTCP